MAAPSITRSIPKERTFSEAKSKKDLKTLLDIVEPKLMVNRSIRSFLANYNVRQWQQVIKYLLVFGTATLQEKYGSQILSVEELKELSRTAQARVVFNKGIPALSDALEQMRTQLHDFEREIDMNKIDLKENKKISRKKPASKIKQMPQPAKAVEEEVLGEAPVQVIEAEPLASTTPSPPVSSFGNGRADPRDTLEEKYRRRKLYGATASFPLTKGKTLKKKPSSSWRLGDDLKCPKDPEDGCCEDEYTPYPKCSYVHDPNVSEEDQGDEPEDDFNVYEYLYTPAPPASRARPKTAPAFEGGDEAEEEASGGGVADAGASEQAKDVAVEGEGGGEASANVQSSLGAFYNDHWMSYFVDRHSGTPEAFERMGAYPAAGASAEAEGTSARIISDLSKPFGSTMEFSSSDFNAAEGDDGEDEPTLNPKGNWRYLKGKEYQHGGWVGEYDFTEQGRKPIKEWVKESAEAKGGEAKKTKKTGGGMKWDFDEILAL